MGEESKKFSSSDFVRLGSQQYEEENMTSISYNTMYIEANFGGLGDSVS